MTYPNSGEPRVDKGLKSVSASFSVSYFESFHSFLMNTHVRERSRLRNEWKKTTKATSRKRLLWRKGCCLRGLHRRTRSQEPRSRGYCCWCCLRRASLSGFRHLSPSQIYGIKAHQTIKIDKIEICNLQSASIYVKNKTIWTIWTLVFG